MCEAVLGTVSGGDCNRNCDPKENTTLMPSWRWVILLISISQVDDESSLFLRWRQCSLLVDRLQFRAVAARKLKGVAPNWLDGPFP